MAAERVIPRLGLILAACGILAATPRCVRPLGPLGPLGIDNNLSPGMASLAFGLILFLLDRQGLRIEPQYSLESSGY
jgi:hypothetical protein